MSEGAPGYIATRNPSYQPGVLEVSEVRAAGALDEIRHWPGYGVTPLVPFPRIASDLGVSKVWYKDEATRFGIGSFKPMGGGYAVARIVARHVEASTGRPLVTSGQLLAGSFRDLAGEVTVACATDGNHGRAVAWAARTFGCRAVVYLAGHVTEFREQAIAAYGAEVRRSGGNHDDAVREMATQATKRGWAIVSETARASDPMITRDILAGYGSLALEIESQLGEEQAPTHVFVQTGVGGLAAGFIANAWARWGEGMPRTVTVESINADCVRRSLESSKPVTVTGDLETVMAGLAAGVVSEMAWPYLQLGAFAGVSISDEFVAPAMTRLAAGSGGEPVVEAGESGAAALAALLAVAEDQDARDRLELDRDSRVVVLGTEGVTDPEVFHRLVGRAATRVFGGTGIAPK